MPPHEILCYVKVARLSWDTTRLNLKLRTTLIWIQISAQFGFNQLSEGSKVHVTTITRAASALLHMSMGVQSEYYSWERKVVHNVQKRNMTEWTPGTQLLQRKDGVQKRRWWHPLGVQINSPFAGISFCNVNLTYTQPCLRHRRKEQKEKKKDESFKDALAKKYR